MTIKAFLKECGEREVIKKLSIYIVSAWVLIQVLAVTWEPLGLPEKSVTFLIIALLVGFPLYIFYIWRSSLAALERINPRISKKGKVKKSGFQKMYFSSLLIVSFLCILAVSLIIGQNFGSKTLDLAKMDSSGKIAILEFGNNTGSEEFNIIGKMTSDWIMHGITENQLGQVVSPEIVTDYVSILKNSEKTLENKDVISKYFKPGKVINGNYYLDGEKLLFQSSITDGDINETLIAFSPIECDKDTPLDCIESLKQKILGYLITEEHSELNLQETPPKYMAYQNVIEAKAAFADKEKYIDLLNQAVELDSNYFEPKVLRVAHYYDLGYFATADSILREVKQNTPNNSRQQNLLNMYEALLAGDSKKAYNYLYKEYELATFDLQTNSSTMVLALQYVNRPEAIDSIYKQISMDNMDLENCINCQFRYYVQGLANVELGRYDETIALMEPVTDLIPDFYLKRPLISAYVRSGNFDQLESLFDKMALITEEDLQQAYLYSGKLSRLTGSEEKAVDYFQRILEMETQFSNPYMVSLAKYYLGEYENVEAEMIGLYEDDSSNIDILVFLANTYYHNGKVEQAEELIAKLDEMRADYQYGAIDYGMAQYYAAVNDEKLAFRHLLQAIADGHSYTPQTFQNDPHLLNLMDKPLFQNIMKFWH